MGPKTTKHGKGKTPHSSAAAADHGGDAIWDTASVEKSLVEINQRIEHLYDYAAAENIDMLSAEAYSIKALAGGMELCGTRELANGLHLACLKNNIHEARFLVDSLKRIVALESDKLQRRLKPV